MRIFTILCCAVTLYISVANAWAQTPTGFTLNTSLQLAFDKSCYPAGGLSTATITINGGLETDANGTVTIIGSDGSSVSQTGMGGAEQFKFLSRMPPARIPIKPQSAYTQKRIRMITQVISPSRRIS